MRTNYLLKTIPFITTILIIVFLNISNNKEFTRLKILIWNTPSLTLGTYLSLSTGSGFILSYIIISNIARNKQPSLKKVTRYTVDNESNDSSDFIDSTNVPSYDNIMIERDIKEPSPTLKASFRVIGKTRRRNELRNINEQYESTGLSNDYVDSYVSKDLDKRIDNDSNLILDDWTDEGFLNW